MDGDKRFHVAAVALVVLVAVFGYRTMHPSTSFVADGKDVAWDAAVQRSRAAGRPTVVLFTADWCPACRALHANVLMRDDVERAFIGHYSFYTVDLTHPSPTVQARAQAFGVRAIPLMIRYDVEGKETGRGNFGDAPSLIEWLRAGE